MSDLSPVDEARYEVAQVAEAWGRAASDSGALDLAAIRLVTELEAERTR